MRSIKVQDMNLRDLGEKTCKYQSCYFCHKKALFRCRMLRGVQWCCVHLSVLHIFVKKRIWKFYIWTFSKLLDDMKAIFKPIDLKFGIDIVNTYLSFIFTFFFENLNFQKLYRAFFSIIDFLKMSRSKIHNFAILR